MQQIKEQNNQKTTKTMKTAKQSLEYTTKFINQNFRIKAYGQGENGLINKLLGVAGALALIGAELLNKFIGRALKAGLDKCVCKLRRGLVITLYVK